MPAVVPFDKQLEPAEGTPRQRLARWVTSPQNRAFSREAVNRVWALVVGKPLVEPIDDIPLKGPYPPGLELLADDFVRHGYDVQRLIRVIAGTRVFQLDSRAAAGQPDVTEKQERRLAAFPLSRLRSEQVAGGLLQAASLQTIDAQAHVVLRIARYIQENNFVKRYGDTGEDEFNDRGGTIPQRLLMMNGELVKDRTRENLLLNSATRIAILSSNDDRACSFQMTGTTLWSPSSKA